MECPICLRDNERLPFFCTTCARNLLYESRFENALALVQKESIVHQVEEVAARVGDYSDNSQRNGEKTAASDDFSRRWAVEHALAATELSTRKTRRTLAHLEPLKSKLLETKAEVSKRKTDIARRRSDLAAAKAQIEERRAASLTTVEKSIKRTEHLWGNVHAQTVDARSFLCHEAAILYGLKQRKRKRGGAIREEYVIGTVGILDLQDLNSASAASITACYTNVANLLVLISNYLSLRLPAEITIPRRGYPLPTIFAPLSSYQHRDVPFPGTTPSHSSTNSPSASRISDQRPAPRPRPLFTNKKLPKLAKEDQVGYSLLLEGVTLLAWDVAWACRTQGINVGNSWEDACAIGRNLWQLVVGPPLPSPTTRRVASREVQVKNNSERDSSGTPPPSSLRRLAQGVVLGQLSHGTAHSFLRSVDGGDLMKPWKFQSHLKIVDKLRATLHGEMNNAEWELLEEKEWDDGGYQFNEGEAVLVRNKPLEGPSHPNYDAMSMITAPTPHEDESSTPDDSEPGKAKGTSGWTKLKPR